MLILKILIYASVNWGFVDFARLKNTLFNLFFDVEVIDQWSVASFFSLEKSGFVLKMAKKLLLLTE
ncbi:MAG: hypothetical protein J6Q45_01320 [Alistipes sp.]|nr:hypothetical protein [Alistipes sp.]